MAPKTATTQSLGRAPASRTYRSTPLLKQTRLSVRRSTAKKPASGPSMTPASAPPRTRKRKPDNTLTQMGYVQSSLDPDYTLRRGEDDMESEQEREPQRKRRRRTKGDESVPSSSSLSMRDGTMTQFFPNVASGEEDDSGWHVRDSQDEGEELSPTKSPRLSKHGGQKVAEQQQLAIESRQVSMVPQTPVKMGAVRQEVAPSQPTVSSPMLDRYNPMGQFRSPLGEKSANVALPPVGSEKSARKRRPDYVVQDSYATTVLQSSCLEASSPQGKKTPAQVGELSEPAGSPGSTLRWTVQTPTRKFQRKGAGRRAEIPDSDDELLSLGPTPRKSASSQTPKTDAEREVSHGEIASSHDLAESHEDEENGESENEAGSPTPLPRKSHSANVEATTIEAPSTPTPASDQLVAAESATNEQNPEIHESELLERVDSPPASGRILDTPAKSQYFTQDLESQRVPLEVIRALAPQTDRSDIIISLHPEPLAAIVHGTKTHEFRSYRLPAQVSRIWIYVTRPVCELQYMAIIGPAKQPGDIDDAGLGNAEFNNSGAGKGRGGRGAAAHKFAHELLQVYQLNNPVPLDVMRENGWMENAPQKFVYVPPAVVGQLLGNLRCALFEEGQGNGARQGDGGDGGYGHGASISQEEIEAQIRGDIAHSTQLRRAGRSSGRGSSNSSALSIIPSSQEPHPAPPTSSDPPPSVATSRKTPVHFARPANPPIGPRPDVTNQSSQRRRPQVFSHSTAVPRPSSTVRPSQATTASAPGSPIAIAISPEQSLPRPCPPTSDTPFPFASYPDRDLLFTDDDNESPRALRVAARVLTTTTTTTTDSGGSSVPVVLPESLVRDAARRPPVIWDTDEEDDGEGGEW